MEPSRKSVEMTTMLDKLSKELFGQDRTGAIRKDICVSCHKPATEFRDGLSRKEFAISGFCQTCQDKVFGASEEDEDEEYPVELYDSTQEP